MLAVVFQNKLFIQPGHPLLIQEVHKASDSIGFCLQQTFDCQIANRDQHPICLIVSVIGQLPVDRVNIQRIYICKEHQQFSQLFFPGFRDVGMEKHLHCCLDDPVHIGVFGEIIIGANQLAL